MGAAWIQTLSGKQFWPLEPEPEKIDIDELATILSRVVRFAGHTKRLYTVAEHSVWVAELVADNRSLRLPALLHDAHEAYSGFGDVASPVKQLAPIIKDIETRINHAVAVKFGFAVESFDAPEIRHADLVMLATEKRFLMEDEPAPWIDLPEPLECLPRIGDPRKAFLESFKEFIL